MKIGIVGTGNVGSTAAYSLVLQGIGSELVLVDHNPSLADAQAMDILHATPLTHPIHIRRGNFEDLRECALVIVAAGVNQQAGESRLALLQRNTEIFSEIIPRIVHACHDAVLLIATNPLDIMTHVATAIAARSGMPAERIIGTGTILDTARFRALIGEYLEVAPGSVHAYVLGEHGDSEVLGWSGAMIAGISLEEFSSRRSKTIDENVIASIDSGVRRAAYQIIEGKSYTCYGIGAAIAALSRCILFDERSIYTTSGIAAGFSEYPSVAFSLPRIIGRKGILGTLLPPLNTSEQQALKNSAELIASHVNAIGY